MTNNKFYVLAFDIERSGGTATYETMAIGAAVLNQDYELQDSYYYSCYVPGETKFEERCWNEFWSKNEDILKQLENNRMKGGTYSKDNYCPPDQLHPTMVVYFVEFVQKWESLAKEKGIKLHRVCDNSPYDVSFLNDEIYNVYKDKLNPFPYHLYDKSKYGSLWETHSMMRGFLNGVDPSFKKDWGYSKRMKELYPKLPECDVKHDHMPQHDAQTIAHEFIWLERIQEYM